MFIPPEAPGSAHNCLLQSLPAPAAVCLLIPAELIVNPKHQCLSFNQNYSNAYNICIKN